jgi:hypothetical protein
LQNNKKKNPAFDNSKKRIVAITENKTRGVLHIPQRMEDASLFRAELDLTLKTTESVMVRARGKQRGPGRGGARDDAAILDGIIVVGADSTSNDWEPIVDMPFSLVGCRRRLRTD